MGASYPFYSSWSASLYSFRCPSFSKPDSWCPRAIHHSTSCPNLLRNSHQTSICGPRFLFIFRGNFSISTTSGILSISRYEILNLGRKDRSSPTLYFSPLLVEYGARLEFAFFPVEVSSTIRVGLSSLGLVCPGYELLHFRDTTSSALIWATTYRRISSNVSFGFLISESLNGPTMTPCSKALTIMTSSRVRSLTVNAQNPLRNSSESSLPFASH